MTWIMFTVGCVVFVWVLDIMASAIVKAIDSNAEATDRLSDRLKKIEHAIHEIPEWPSQ